MQCRGLPSDFIKYGYVYISQMIYTGSRMSYQELFFCYYVPNVEGLHVQTTSIIGYTSMLQACMPTLIACLSVCLFIHRQSTDVKDTI